MILLYINTSIQLSIHCHSHPHACVKISLLNQLMTWLGPTPRGGTVATVIYKAQREPPSLKGMSCSFFDLTSRTLMFNLDKQCTVTAVNSRVALKQYNKNWLVTIQRQQKLTAYQTSSSESAKACFCFANISFWLAETSPNSCPDSHSCSHLFRLCPAGGVRWDGARRRGRRGKNVIVNRNIKPYRSD